MNESGRRRRRQIARVLAGILGLNLVVAAAKIAYGIHADAIALTADGLHSLLDASSNVIGLVAIAIANRPPDANHPYGHRKVETFAALGIVMMLMIGCWEIALGAAQRLVEPRLPSISVTGLLIVLATLVVNLFVVAVERREGRRLRSEILMADAAHTVSDVFATLLVLASFALGRMGLVWADAAAAAIIVLFILRAALGILRSTFATLADERRLPPDEVESVALAEPGVMEAHNVRTRGPVDDIHLDLHVLVAPALSIAEAHALGHRVEARLRERWPDVSDVVVHVEPALDQERAVRREGGGLQARG